MTTRTFRQQDSKYSIYPSTIRDRLDYLYLDLIKLKMKRYTSEMTLRKDAIEKCYDFLIGKVKWLWIRSYLRDANSEIYEQVIRDEIEKIATEVYGKDLFATFAGVMKLQAEDVF